MMKRRVFLLYMPAAVIAGGGTLALRRGLAVEHAIIERFFGKEIAQHTTTQEFLRSYVAPDVGLVRQAKAFIKSVLGETSRRREQHLLLQLVQSTNVVLFAEGRVEDYEFSGISDPYVSPCANQLTSNWFVDVGG
ncbi:hypothetical protein [Shimia sp. R9_2]|uniref:hypothetical protein n=1 Tax=Shimia sp. R9_2 TaxID=2821112 RepID=UPI001ADBAE7C|nr:hypothetical protein [Shimia sp. R9_2]